MAAEVKRGDGRAGRSADVRRWSTQASLDELALLADTAGARVVGYALQRLDRPNRAT
ncbi:MAG: hypothetical protein IIC87_07675, partial [Chloroflexi bacterium]|nr:hypothetical protein [Chloroflexota bacterium]